MEDLLELSQQVMGELRELRAPVIDRGTPDRLEDLGWDVGRAGGLQEMLSIARTRLHEAPMCYCAVKRHTVPLLTLGECSRRQAGRVNVKNVINCLRLLDEIAEHQPIGVGELSRRVGLPKSTAQRALLTLEEAGWIMPADAGSEFTRWMMTTKPLELSRRGADVTLRDLALPVMEALREQTQETIHLMVARGTNIVLIERLQTPKPVRIVLALGTSMPIYASATGKAVLAASPPDTVEQVIDSGLPQFTRTTIADPTALRVELAHIRELGYATNNGEWRDDVSAVAAAVVDASGAPIASLSVSMPSGRMPVDRGELGARVKAAAASLTAIVAAHQVIQ